MPLAEEQKYDKLDDFFIYPRFGMAKKKGGSGTLKTGYFWTLLPLNLFEKHHVYMNIKIVKLTSLRVFGLKAFFFKF